MLSVVAASSDEKGKGRSLDFARNDIFLYLRPTHIEMKSKTILTIASIILVATSLAHLLRLLYDGEMTVGGCSIQNWISIIGTLVPTILVFQLRTYKEVLRI